MLSIFFFHKKVSIPHHLLLNLRYYRNKLSTKNQTQKQYGQRRTIEKRNSKSRKMAR